MTGTSAASKGILAGFYGLGETLIEDGDNQNPKHVSAVVRGLIEVLVPSLALIDREFTLVSSESTRKVRGVPLTGVFTEEVILLRSGRVTPLAFYNPVPIEEMILSGNTTEEQTEAALGCFLQLEVYHHQIETETVQRVPTRPRQTRRVTWGQQRSVAV